MSLVSRSLHDLANTDGSLDRRYPDGLKPSSGASSLSINLVAFNAAAINLANIQQSSPVDINYRTYLTGTSAATATLTVNAASGSIANWIVDSSGNGISNTTTVTGSGSLFVSANDGAGTIVNFPTQPWVILALVQQNKKKWNPGHYGAAQNELTATPNTSDMNLIQGNPNIIGYRILPTWSLLEPTQGNYDFSAIDATFNYLKGLSDGPRHLAIMVVPGSFTSPFPGVGKSGALPLYLTQNVSLYGQAGYRVAPAITFTAAPIGTSATITSAWPYLSNSHTLVFSDGTTRTANFTLNSTAVSWSGALTTSPTTTAAVKQFTETPSGVSGYWGGNGQNTYAAMLHNSGVNARWIALCQALGAHLDSDPMFEAYGFVENSWIIAASTTNGEPTYNAATWAANFQTALTATLAAFPTTSIYWQNSWLDNPTLSQTSQSTAAANKGFAMGTADSFGATYFATGAQQSPGMCAYFGQVYAGSTWSPAVDERPSIPAMLDVQTPDFGAFKAPVSGFPNGFTPQDIVTAANSTYKATHLFWSIILSGSTWVQSAAWWPNVVTVCNANPLIRTAYPTGYP